MLGENTASPGEMNAGSLSGEVGFFYQKQCRDLYSGYNVYGEPLVMPDALA